MEVLPPLLIYICQSEGVGFGSQYCAQEGSKSGLCDVCSDSQLMQRFEDLT